MGNWKGTGRSSTRKAWRRCFGGLRPRGSRIWVRLLIFGDQRPERRLIERASERSAIGRLCAWGFSEVRRYFRAIAEYFSEAAERFREIAERFRAIAEYFREAAERFRVIAEYFWVTAEYFRVIAEDICVPADYFIVIAEYFWAIAESFSVICSRCQGLRGDLSDSKRGRLRGRGSEWRGDSPQQRVEMGRGG
jgi:hypothetical protein